MNGTDFEEIVFRQAVRENTAVILALCGGSGSGKTLSALLLATGLAGDGDIYMIDSEGGRGKHYADDFKFKHFDWREPYTPESLGNAIKAAERAGAAVVIVDSASSEHEDEGGLVDMAEAEYAKQPPGSKNSAAAWARPKAQHKKHIVRWLRTARCHVIFCCRASEKVRFEQQVDDTGRKRTVIVPLGWTPIVEKNLLYDVTTSLLFTPDRPGVPQPIKLYEKHRAFFPPDRVITWQAGQQLAEWAAGGAAKAVERSLRDRAYDAALGGTGPLRLFWDRLDGPSKRALMADGWTEIKEAADAVDRQYAEKAALASQPAASAPEPQVMEERPQPDAAEIAERERWQNAISVGSDNGEIRTRRPRSDRGVRRGARNPAPDGDPVATTERSDALAGGAPGASEPARDQVNGPAASIPDPDAALYSMLRAQADLGQRQFFQTWMYLADDAKKRIGAQYPDKDVYGIYDAFRTMGAVE